MQTTKVKQGQTFFDTVIETTGDITNAFDMAMANNISITDTLINQMDLVVSGVEKTTITQLFKVAKPASMDKESYSIYDYIFPQVLPIIL
ncbi:hypothetical protein HX004_13990 [Myroides sp. 1354]|uniref:hypothetical protein n=1 Tax=unclassified Myroides TaxID=2642485 RepID=UPI0025787555|nr:MULTISPECIES: hypothetical protein [unclassified Myroides]MDM1045865.1 hypothetical protein [Myroides sp. R163-1]MDM1056875.1 hypothetical protein [Myroides sp. 1354]MDM1070070.1 hypothetical protein [Myroides sp. 1372]